MALAVVFGVWIGFKLSNGNNTTQWNTGLGSSKLKIQAILNLIDREYVDSIELEKIEETTINYLLEQLDPFSAYIPAHHLQAVNEPLEGNFDGIGVEFQVLDDTVVVLNVISGGPSETAGVLAGDKLLFVNNDTLSGVGISSVEVVKKVRGPKGTTAVLQILRNGRSGIYTIAVERGKVPLYSIDASFMLSSDVGYVRLNKFGATTAKELSDALVLLHRDGMQKLILDLRENPGGYLDAAIEVANQFIEKGKIITYTEGRKRKKRVFYAESEGLFATGPLAILIDESSASASEIVAGALQDHDRAQIFGRRSFGKGLVQEQIALKDGSALRLTVSRYFTPLGRSIQKPYQAGKYESLYDWDAAFKRGEYSFADSIQFADSLKFTTNAGKIVYGGGGIMPDVFVPIDTTLQPTWVYEVVRGGGMHKFIQQEILSKNISKPKSLDSFIDYFNPSTADVQLLVSFSDFQGKTIHADQERYLKNAIKAAVARHWFGSKAYFQIIESTDPVVQKAVDWLQNQN